MNSLQLPFNWFDLAIVIFLVVGINFGRKHGMSVELLGALKWLAIIVVCAAVYQPFSLFITTSSDVFSKLSANIIAYIGLGLMIATVFAFLKKTFGGKLVGSDVFGRSEFYLGMVAGALKFLCILFVALALLNARLYTQAEVKANLKYQNDVYGSNFFPSLYEVQTQVFDKSLTGPWIKKELDWLLIKPTVPEQKQLARRKLDLP
jgi:uncharacterized membrane protein required for colicin V production